MPHDPALFRPADIDAVYGPERICFQTAKRPTFQEPVDAHHILGRGKTGDRSIFSSIFNLAWLRRDIHEGPLRDAYDQRQVYLRVAKQHGMNAVGRGDYELTEIDHAFLAYVDSLRDQ